MINNNNDANQKNKSMPESNKDSFTKKLGDKIERAGEKVSEKAPGAGEYIKKVGDKVEHSQDDKNTRR